MIWAYSILITCTKLMLMPAYRSTDFEVHRNWLALTHSLPIKRWYYEDTSPWTLDYPPLFAWFEYMLSFIAQLFDPAMLDVDNLNYASKRTVLFQRVSVIAADLFLIFATYKCSKLFPKGKRAEIILPILLIANPGLLMIDHIHFQYNGILFGILMLSISYIMQEKHLAAAFWFLILINMKHIYIYIAPAYFIYLLRNYCFTNKSDNFIDILKSISIKNIIKLGFTVVSVFLITFMPFLNNIDQVLSRLFPFKRGLSHAYWAPNFWALYNAIDKIGVVFASKIGVNLNVARGQMTGGLVQEVSHSVLPHVSPAATIVLTFLFMLPAMCKLWNCGSKPNNFVRCIVLCALTSFVFGWHVHEKAILMAIIPLSIVAVMEPGDAKVFLLLSTVGSYSLFPLLFPHNLLFIKILMLFIYLIYAFYSLYSLYPFQFCKYTLPLLNSLESVYVMGLLPLFCYTEVLHSFLSFTHKLPFLPLMLTSFYCSLGVLYCYVKYYAYVLIKCKN